MERKNIVLEFDYNKEADCLSETFNVSNDDLKSFMKEYLLEVRKSLENKEDVLKTLMTKGNGNIPNMIMNCFENNEKSGNIIMLFAFRGVMEEAEKIMCNTTGGVQS